MEKEMMGLRPGGLALTEECIRLAHLKKGQTLLDIGCGTGESIAFIEKEFALDCIGIDQSKALISYGLSQNPGLQLKEGDGGFLEFASYSFHGVLMECTLSLMRNPLEALHESYCVLKKGGKIMITDLYLKNPDIDQVYQMLRTAEEAKVKQHNHEPGKCEEEHGEPPSDCMIHGAFVKELLLEKVKDAGFSLKVFEDKSEVLKSFMATAIMNQGSIENYWKAVLPEGSENTFVCNTAMQKGVGYFLLIAEKEA